MKLDLKPNLGTIDRVIRAIISLSLIMIAYSKMLTGWLGALSIIFGILLFIDAILGYCIVYDLAGWSTLKK